MGTLLEKKKKKQQFCRSGSFLRSSSSKFFSLRVDPVLEGLSSQGKNTKT